MISVEKLKEQFSVLDVQAYGKCLVIPKAEFIADLQAMLKESDVRVHLSHMGGPVYLVPLSDLEEKVSAQSLSTLDTPNTPSTSNTPPVPMRDSELCRGWSLEDDNKLIELWNQKPWLIIDKITEFFPNRAGSSVKNRLQRLRVAGKIGARYGGPKKHKKQKVLPSEKEAQSKPVSQPIGPASPTVARATPFTINTTLTVQIIVNCNDKKSVENFLEVVKGLGSMLRGG